MSFIPSELIKKKRDGNTHSFEEINFLISQYTQNKLTDYQMSAWLMAVYLKGLNIEETSWLTKIMKDSGKTLDFSSSKIPAIDKHSTGGVGDKVSIILAPLVSSFNIPVPMISGRGLGHTGGTLDKLESIPGFNVDYDIKEIKNIVIKNKMIIAGQSEEFCPADKKIYALRDVTGTIESIPLICASIMSKKLAEGISGLIMDVKFGNGAFMKTEKNAEKLARQLKAIGKNNGVEVIAMLTNMNQPLGSLIGNSLEIKECLEILQGKKKIVKNIDLYKDIRDLVVSQAAHMLILAKKAKNIKQATKMALGNLKNKKALKQFYRMCKIQKGKLDFKVAKYAKPVLATSSGYISYIDTEKVGVASLLLGAGRRTKADQIDYQAGIELKIKLGMRVEAGDTLGFVYSNNHEKILIGSEELIKSIKISNKKPKKIKLISKII